MYIFSSITDLLFDGLFIDRPSSHSSKPLMLNHLTNQHHVDLY